MTLRPGAVAWAAALLACGLATAQPHPPPVPTEAPDDDAPAVVDPDASVTAWRAVPVVDASVPVAAGRGVTVTVAELVERMRDVSGAVQDRYATHPELVRELVDRIVADRLLVAEARRRGLEGDPIVRAAVERALVARLRAVVLNPEADVARPTDDEVRQWYDAHPERFHIPERRRARVIFVDTARRAAELLRLARVRRGGRYVQDFRRLAAQHNTDPHLRSMAGDLRDVTASPTPGALELDPALRAAIFEVPREGETLGRVVPARWQGREGFFLVHVVSWRRPEERSLASQADWIRLRLVAERRVAAERARVEALAREAGVTRNAVEHMIRFEPVPDAGLDATADAGLDAGPGAGARR